MAIFLKWIWFFFFKGKFFAKFFFPAPQPPSKKKKKKTLAIGLVQLMIQKFIRQKILFINKINLTLQKSLTNPDLWLQSESFLKL